jgi:error-prone DNA polymerase
MERKNIPQDKIDKIIQAITSFALYGFPESHAISFAILAYASAYLKVHRAPEFFASLINNQPMGFYTPATIVKDAQRHGVKVKPVCVKKSDWRCTVLDDNTFRLGFCVVNGLRQEHGEQIERARDDRQFKSLEDFKSRVSLSKEEMRTLAELGALNCFSKHRRAAMWKVEEAMHDDLLGSACASHVVSGAPAGNLPPFGEAPNGAREGACAPQRKKILLHANCLKNRRSFWLKWRMSGMSNKIIARRSIPRPKAKPLHFSGS